MATRRNVPSKDLFRVIKCSFDRAPRGSSDLPRKTRLLHEGCFRDTISYSNTRYLTRIRPRHSIFRRQAVLHSVCPTAIARQICPRFGSSIRSVSTSKKSTTASPPELPHADVPLHFDDIETTQSAYSFFPVASTTDSNVQQSPSRHDLQRDENRASHPPLPPPQDPNRQGQYPPAPDSKPSKEKDGTETQHWVSEETIDEVFEDHIPTVDIDPSSEDVVFTIPPYLAPDRPIPIYIPSEIGCYVRTIEDYDDRRHNYLYNHILLTRVQHGHGAAIQAAGEILKSYVNTKLDQDWELTKRLYKSLCYRFMSAPLRVIRHSLVRSMLEESPPRLEAVSLFTEKIESDRNTTTRHIHNYLESFCEEQPDWKSRLAHIQMILQGVREYPELQTTKILLPLVRYAVADNDPDYAHDLTVRFSRDYSLSIDFGVFSEIMKGYSRQGNMSAIDELLGYLHHEGFSRTKPYAFAALVRTVFQFLIPVRDPRRMFDFLTYSLLNHGLVPTTALSVSVVKHFVVLRQFDLLQRWADTKRTLFPNVLNPGDTPMAAYEINEAWTHMVASPSDALLTCKALAYGTLRDPFCEEFRYMTNNWLLSSLYRMYKDLMLQSDIEEQLIGFKRFSNLESMFEFCTSLIKLASRANSNTRNLLLVDTFRRKVEAAQETEFLVNRFHEYVQQYGPILKFEAQSIPQLNFTKKRVRTPRLPLETQRMIKYKLARTMIETYGNSQSSGDRDERDIVIDTIRYLQRAQRHVDCAILVREFWSSGFVTGKFFTHEIIKTWVRMSYEMRHPKMLHEALWAAIDSDSGHVIGYKFLMLIRVAVSVITEEVQLGRLLQYPNQLEELKYLVSRCYRRRWQQDGCPKVWDIADPYLKKWKMEQDESVDSQQIRYDYVL